MEDIRDRIKPVMLKWIKTERERSKLIEEADKRRNDIDYVADRLTDSLILEAEAMHYLEQLETLKLEVRLEKFSD